MAKGKSGLTASSKAVDPTLDALFSQSPGAVKTPPKSRYAELLPRKSTKAPEREEEEAEQEQENNEDNEDLSEDDAGGSDSESGDSSEGLSGDKSDDTGEASSDEDESEAADGQDDDASSVDDEAEAAEVLERVISRGASREEGRKRRRKQREEDGDLEINYLERLASDAAPSVKRRKKEPRHDAAAAGEADGPRKEDGAHETAEESDEHSGDEVPVHESLTASAAAFELEKANRTVFLSNVSIDAITSRQAKKTLLRHLSSVLDKKADHPQEVQSIRFRSTAFATAAIPKRAAYIKKSVLEATTKSTNAYAVYSTTAAARLAVAQLNGTSVLDRHLRVDSVAHPSPVDHRRCVFVGNLGFVDDETVYNVKLDGEGKEVAEKRKRTKTPMDVEEGLWRVFGKAAGKVESVRVVRDAATRVGKGFAYVQFYDANAVEAAILFNGKKFPPMLPRELRVSRCKAPHKTARAMEARREKQAVPSSSDRRKGRPDNRTNRKGKRSDGETSSSTTAFVPKPSAEAQTLAGRASKLLGRFGAAQLVGNGNGNEAGRKKRKQQQQREGDGKGAGGPRHRRESGAGKGTKDSEDAPGVKKKPEAFVFEGRRASAKDGKPKDLKFKTRKKGQDKVHKKSGKSKSKRNSKAPAR